MLTEVFIKVCYTSGLFYPFKINTLPITVVKRSKVWIVFARSNAGIVGPNPTQGMDLCVHLFCVSVVLYVGRGFATVWSAVQGVLPTVCKIMKLKKRTMSNKRL
jgi:hypothetical protein